MRFPWDAERFGGPLPSYSTRNDTRIRHIRAQEKELPFPLSPSVASHPRAHPITVQCLALRRASTFRHACDGSTDGAGFLCSPCNLRPDMSGSRLQREKTAHCRDSTCTSARAKGAPTCSGGVCNGRKRRIIVIRHAFPRVQADSACPGGVCNACKRFRDVQHLTRSSREIAFCMSRWRLQRVQTVPGRAGRGLQPLQRDPGRVALPNSPEESGTAADLFDVFHLSSALLSKPTEQGLCAVHSLKLFRTFSIACSSLPILIA